MSNQNLKTQTANTQDKSYRIVAILIALASVVAFFLPLKVWTDSAVANKALFGVIAELSKSPYEMYGVLPILGNSASAFNRLSSYVSYAFITALIAAFVLSVIAIINGKKSDIFAKLATYVFTWGVAGYSITIMTITSFVDSTVIRVDVSTLVLAIIGAAIYFCLMLKANGKKAIIGAAQFVVSLFVIAMVILAITHHGATVAKALDKDMAFKTYLAFAVFALMVLFAVQTFFAFCKKNTYLNLIVALAQALLVLVVALVAQVANINNKNYAVYTLIAAIFAFLQILFACLLAIKTNKTVVSEKPVEEPKAGEFIGELAKNECIEVYPYDGAAPVAGIYVAELVELPAPATETVAATPVEETKAEVAPAAEVVAETPAEETAPVAEVAEVAETAEVAEETPAEEVVPVVETQAFDPFITTLTDEERLQFTDIFILKTVNMPEIPAYQVGGNNKAFFNKVFIYLGQYRNKIPSPVLKKMYEFSMKI